MNQPGLCMSTGCLSRQLLAMFWLALAWLLAMLGWVH